MIKVPLTGKSGRSLTGAEKRARYPLRVRILKIDENSPTADVARDGRANLTEAGGDTHAIDFEFEGDVRSLRSMNIPRTFPAKAITPTKLAVFDPMLGSGGGCEFTIRYSLVPGIYKRSSGYFGIEASQGDPPQEL
jgi:hypothetical protein